MRLSIFNFSVLGRIVRQPAGRWAWFCLLILGGVLTYGVAAWQCFRFDLVGKVRYDLRNQYFWEGIERSTIRTRAVEALGDDTKVLFLGSSHIDCGVRPHELSMPAMGLNLHEGSYELFELLLKQHRETLSGLEVLVLELDPACFAADRLSTGRDFTQLYELGLRRRDLPRSWWWRTQQAVLESRWARPVFFGRRWSPYREHYDVLARKEKRGAGPMRKRWAGHMELFNVMTPDNMPVLLKKVDFERVMVPELLERNEEALNRMIAWCEKESVALVFVTVPHWPAYPRYREGEWVPWYETVKKRVFDRAPEGTLHWDDFGSHGMPEGDFADVQHLNKTGAEKYTQRLDARLKALLEEAK